ncbi:hypothetical protein HYO28_09130, partial [Vibrio parahaemolyticus]|nr:hypothetical protein [Vibrio parahaemolyticus]
EGQQQLTRTINIEALPRITPKSASKITSPDYPHDLLTSPTRNPLNLYHRRHRRENVENCVGSGGVG